MSCHHLTPLIIVQLTWTITEEVLSVLNMKLNLVLNVVYVIVRMTKVDSTEACMSINLNGKSIFRILLSTVWLVCAECCKDLMRVYLGTQFVTIVL